MVNGKLHFIFNFPFSIIICMELTLNQLLPEPLKASHTGRNSGVWQQSLTLEQGEVISLVAPSGAGKTTLLHILYGIRDDYTGDARWDHTPVRAMSPEALAALRAQQVSMIFQDLRLFPQLTVYENLELKRSLTNTVTQAEIGTWLTRLGMAHKQHTIVRTLSYGERQRIAIIRSLLQPFRWLLMDEPFSHLDPENTGAAIALIQEVAGSNKASLLLAGLEANTCFDYTQIIRL